MNVNEVKKALIHMSRLICEYNTLHEHLMQSGWFDDLRYMAVTAMYPNCTITEEGLTSSSGVLLSSDGNCMDEDLPYFVNQCGGYSGDDFSGTLFFKVDDNNTFVAVEYEC